MEETRERKKGYFKACVAAIRTSPYGKDAREPIACALERIRKSSDSDPDTHDYTAEIREYAENAETESEEVLQQLNESNQTLQTAIGTVALDPILGADDYYTLSITRINGR